MVKLVLAAVLTAAPTILAEAGEIPQHENTMFDTAQPAELAVDSWLQQAKLSPPDGFPGDYFGNSVAFSGDTALVGATYSTGHQGASYIFVWNGKRWLEQAKLTSPEGAVGDLFGNSVALEGDTALVGAWGSSGQTGAVYVFVRSGSTWSQQAKLTAPDLAPGDRFGISVALNRETAVVGAPYQTRASGAAYVYVRSGTAWTQQAKLTALDSSTGAQLGFAVAVGGDTAIAGAYGESGEAGAAYVFTRSGTLWSQQTKLTAPGAGLQEFGQSVALTGDVALIGAPADFATPGAAYVYLRSGSEWTSHAKLIASDGAIGQYFGWSVALRGDQAVVGAYGDGSHAGAAYLYRQSGGTYSGEVKLTASDGTPGNQFGVSVAIDGDKAIVGANGLPAGAAYVYRRMQPDANFEISPASAAPRAPVTISASNFAPLESIVVSIFGTGKILGSTTTGSTGSATATIAVPVAPFGRYDLIAKGESSGLFGTASFSITPRLVLTPAGGPPGSTVTVLGLGFGANEPVTIVWNGNLRIFVGSAITDGSGVFAPLTFTVPDGASTGPSQVIAKGGHTFALGATLFDVQ
jgi:hypothetical protein